MIYWGPFLLYSAFIFYQSSMAHVPGAEHFPDKFLHFVGYFAYAFLLWRALVQDSTRTYTWKRNAIIFIVCALYAASDEFHQSFVPGRDCSIYDWFADVAGIIAMITLVTVMFRKFKGANQEAV